MSYFSISQAQKQMRKIPIQETKDETGSEGIMNDTGMRLSVNQIRNLHRNYSSANLCTTAIIKCHWFGQM